MFEEEAPLIKLQSFIPFGADKDVVGTDPWYWTVFFPEEKVFGLEEAPELELKGGGVMPSLSVIFWMSGPEELTVAEESSEEAMTVSCVCWSAGVMRSRRSMR